MSEVEVTEVAAPTPEKKTMLAKVGTLASKGFVAAKWLWSIPFIKSLVGTRLAQAGFLGALALAVGEKAFG